MLTRRIALTLAALLPLAGCAAPATPSPSAAATLAAQSVVVYAPGALSAHTKKLTEAYQAAGGEVTFEVGHTPMQREQLAKGAAPDVWIAANPKDMSAAADAGLVDKAGVKQLGRTKLVVITAPGNPGKVASLADLAKPGLKVLLGADSLPIGTATDATLAKVDATQAGFKAKVTANVASRELGVQPIVNKVMLGEAGAGIVFVTDLPVERKGVETVAVPDDVNTIVSLVIAPVTAGKNKAGAVQFIEFLTAGAGKQLLTTAGYLAPSA